MKVLFDQGTPVPLRRYLPEHRVDTAFERVAPGTGGLDRGTVGARQHQPHVPDHDGPAPDYQIGEKSRPGTPDAALVDLPPWRTRSLPRLDLGQDTFPKDSDRWQTGRKCKLDIT